MCGRFALYSSGERIAERFQLPSAPDLTSRYNIAPSQDIVIIRQGDQNREWAMVRWGLIPFWAEEEKIGYRMINARAETVASKPAFRAAFRHRRCLIPADGFYEWQSPRSRDGKQPYYIKRENDDVFAFAGLWERWQGEEGQVVESCTIIVTAANDRLRPIHDRMPVILDPDDYHTWLDTTHFNAGQLESLLKPYPAAPLTAYPVTARVNSPKNDDKACITQQGL